MAEPAFTIETEQEEDGRWIAEVIDLHGVMVYGTSCDEAVARVTTLALDVVEERLEEPCRTKSPF